MADCLPARNVVAVDPAAFDIMMCYAYSGHGHWNVSLYSDNDIDVSVIAKRNGGGGHRSACGFQVADIRDVLDWGSGVVR